MLNYYDGEFALTGTYYVRLLNQQNAAAGNDFGVDNVYFGLSDESPSVNDNPVDDDNIVSVDTDPVPEPASPPADRDDVSSSVEQTQVSSYRPK